MIAIYKKELKSFFTNAMGCIFIAFMLLMIGIYTVAVNFAQLMPNFEYAIYNAVIVYPFLIPILTMRSLAEEKRQKTEQLLLSAPVRISAIVLGKYFAMLTIVLIPTLFACVLPLILSVYGTIALAPAYSAVLAFFCLGAALTAIGMFISSLTENQIIAAVICLGVMLLLYFMKSLAQMVSASALICLLVFAIAAVCIACIVYIMTSNKTVTFAVGIVLMLALALLYSMYPSALETAFTALLSNLAIFSKMDNFFYGILDLNALVYLVSAAALFVLFTVQSIEKRRWS